MKKLIKAAHKGEDIIPHILRLKEEGAIIRFLSPTANDPLNQTYAIFIRVEDEYIRIGASLRLYNTLKELLYEDR